MTIFALPQDNFVIQASTCNPVTLPGGCTPADYRVLEISAAGDLTLDNLTVRHGKNAFMDSGGGILNDGGILAVNNSTISGNAAGYDAGGIFNDGGTLTVTNSTITGNWAYSRAGGIYNVDGTATINGSTFSDNEGPYGAGLTSWSGLVTITDSVFSGNSATGGGGILFFYDTMTIANSTFTGNVGASYGGGIANSNGTLTVVNSTLSGNSSANGGGIDTGHDAAMTTVINSTLSGNTADNGGGIYSYSGNMVTLTRSLIAGNSATNSGGELRIEGGTVNAGAANVFGHSGLTSAQAFANFSPGVSDVIATSDAGNYDLAAILDTTLANNGGPTQTHALIPGSPAQDIAPGADCAGAPVNGLDQRGEPRPQGAGCDAGSFEAPPYTPPLPQTPTGRIAFMSERHGNQEIYTMNADGSDQKRVTNNPAADSEPAWSPNRTRIAFTSDRDGNGEIYVMDADGGNQTRLTNNACLLYTSRCV